MSPTQDIKQEKSPDSLNGHQTKLEDTPPGPLSHPVSVYDMQKNVSAMAQGGHQASMMAHSMMGHAPQSHAHHAHHAHQGFGLPNGGDVGQLLSEYQTL
jgi:hypothetical protein